MTTVRCQPFVCFSALLLLLIGGENARAQLSNLRTRWVATGSGTASTPLDTLGVLPGSLEILSPADSSWRLVFDSGTNTLLVRGRSLPDSVLVRYRTLPSHLGRSHFRRQLDASDSSAWYRESSLTGTRANDPPETREEFFTTGGLHKSGSLTRGIAVGNTQNVFVNSALNLQLDGPLSDDLSLTAVISDQNVPFQPEGNTQQLQQFDKVFVQLGYQDRKAPVTRGTLTVGDIVMRNPLPNDGGTLRQTDGSPFAGRYGSRQPWASYFLRYYKNVQGGQVAAVYRLGNGGDSTLANARTSAGVAVAKGKFASVLVEATEGSQGPYRLRGPGNERFIVVLANSEKVYLDGQLLRRGFNFDYVIDYNQAEIVFNTNVVITKFSRIRVDFEYADRNYSRTILNAGHTQRTGGLTLSAGYYAERDNPRNPLLLDLSDEDKRLLSSVGDRLPDAVASGATRLDAYDPGLPLYRRTDTTANASPYPGVYVYATDPATARYQLQFTELGPGEGNYRLKNNAVNGRVYEWVAPVGGVPQGSFEPVRPLPAPAKKQLVTLGGEYALNEREALFGEMALSEQDVNLFSSLDAADDRGTAFKVGYVNRGRPLAFLPGYEWVGGVDYEHDSRHFRPIDRFRDIEYDRDWSANPDSAGAADRIFNVSVGVVAPAGRTDTTRVAAPDSLANQGSADRTDGRIANQRSADQLTYRLGRRMRGGEINGTQHRVELSKNLGGWWVRAEVFSLRNRQARLTSDWQRVRTELAHRGRRWVPGYVYRLDRNALTARNDSVVGTAMNFDEHQVYLRTNDSIRTRFGADYAYRRDNAPLAGRLVRNNVAHTANLLLNARIRDQDLALAFTYRQIANLNVKSDDPSTPPKEETLMGRLDWNADFFGRAVRSELSFAVATGRELKREYVFLPVPTGQGTHTWRDENGDGVKDLDEFYEAINFDERTYAKFFVPTDQYLRAYTNNFNYRLNLTPPRRWREGGALLAFFSKLSSVSSWSINRRMTDDRVWERFVPFAVIAPENILSNQEALRATLFFNRSNPRYGMDLAVLRSRQKQLLTNGFEGRNAQEYKLTARTNLRRDWSVRLANVRTVRTTQSDFLTSRNYRIETYQTKPELSYQPSNDFRLTTAYAYARKRNAFTENTAERATFHEVLLETRWTKVSERTWAATLRYAMIDFAGDPNTALGYEMLEALRPGNNLTWSVNWQQKLTGGLQLTLHYEGRRAAAAPAVHVGRVQLAALF